MLRRQTISVLDDLFSGKRLQVLVLKDFVVNRFCLEKPRSLKALPVLLQEVFGHSVLLVNPNLGLVILNKFKLEHTVLRRHEGPTLFAEQTDCLRLRVLDNL